MKRIYICSVFFLILYNINITAQDKIDWDIVLPLNMKMVVSGSFGELRANHFHTGIDFTTSQTVGHPVYAIDEGSVSRVFVSPSGYGKAIYIDHPNGYTSVYGHLDSFAPELDKIVTDLQYANKSFSIDHYLNPGELTFKKGDIIGKSGNSGSSGGPHLHFEIRETQGQKPVNAHFLNIPIKDNVAPHVEAICIYPLDDGGTVNGKTEPLYLPVILSEGVFHVKGNTIVTASGNIGIGVEVHDYYTDSWRKCGIYSISLKADGEKVFESRLDALSFDRQRYINSHIDYSRLKKTGKSVQISFVDKNNRLELYSTNRQHGAVTMIQGKMHEFRYDIKDPAGNLSVVTFKVKGAEKPVAVPVFRPLMLDASKPYTAEINGFRAKFPANSFYTDIPASFSVEPNMGMGLGSYFHILDETIPIHASYEITIPVPDEYLKSKGLCSARFVKGKLAYAGGKTSGSNIILLSREGGVYTLSIDTVAPSIRLLNAPQGRNYAQQKEIRIEIKDNFSGINNYSCMIDGEWQLFEYDAKKNVLIGYFDKFKIKKGIRHTLDIRVADRTGNTKTLTVTVVY